MVKIQLVCKFNEQKVKKQCLSLQNTHLKALTKCSKRLNNILEFFSPYGPPSGAWLISAGQKKF